MSLGRWASETWFKKQHPLSEDDAREIAMQICMDGDLGLAFQFIEQMKSWVTDLMRGRDGDVDWRFWNTRRAYWSGMWMVLMIVTYPPDANYKSKKLKRKRIEGRVG